VARKPQCIATPDPGVPCRICRAPTRNAGEKLGRLRREPYQLRQCDACGFGFVSDPNEDYARIYDEAYYRGNGADPAVDYVDELEHPAETVRIYEWGGIEKLVGSLVDVKATRWLDYGCGNGGLVRFLNQRTHGRAVGFETSWMVDRARAAGIPVLRREELDAQAPFDVVTAIEVLEHLVDPLAVLREIRRLLRPGGLLFLTTGNAEPHRNRLARWSYVIPDIHVSFFEPRTLGRALEQTGFHAEYRGFLPGHEDIIKYKVLKTIRLRRRSAIVDALPWKVLARIVERRVPVTAHPIAWAI
jgi:SAM-dependent methyltransferase